MPCRYWMPGEEAAHRADTLKDELDRLTCENDRLRELLLRADAGELTAADRKKINSEQVKHRKEDLKRLQETFTQAKDATRLGKVMLADPKKPLKPQLGFDPDDF